MRLTAPTTTARVGDVEICGIQSVVELQARGPTSSVDEAKQNKKQQNPASPLTTIAVAPSALHAIESRTAIIVPCKDECLNRIRGIWAAVPSSSLLISVSGSTHEAYQLELDALVEFCEHTGRNAMSIHQRDPHVADALRAAGMVYLLDDSDGLVYKGKGEGMVLGIALAATATGFATDFFVQSATACTEKELNKDKDGCVGVDNHSLRCDNGNSREMQGFAGSTQCTCKDDGICRGSDASSDERQQKTSGRSTPGYYRYIGFVDADNFVPGSAQEYCKAFSAGLYLAHAENAMVRLSWASKPKIQDGKLEFKPSGRSSEIVNRWLNRLLYEMDHGGGAKAIGIPPIGDVDADDEDGDENESLKEDNLRAQILNDLIRTGNAGEHAMTMGLALKLRVASGYAIEPFHYLDIFERMIGVKKEQSSIDPLYTSNQTKTKINPALIRQEQLPVSPASMSPQSSPSLSPINGSPVLTATETAPTSPSIFSTCLSAVPDGQQQLGLSVVNDPRPPGNLTTDVQNTANSYLTPPISPTSENLGPAKVQILQIRTLNPHFHESRGEAHVARMWKQGLSAIYHWAPAANMTQYRDDLRSAIFGGVGASSSSKSDDLPTPPFSNMVSVAVTPVNGSSAINEAAVLAAAAWQPEQCRVYPAPGEFDLAAFRKHLDGAGGSFWWSGMEKLKKCAFDGQKEMNGLGFDEVDVNLLGLGPVSHEIRPEGDVDGFKADVDKV